MTPHTHTDMRPRPLSPLIKHQWLKAGWESPWTCVRESERVKRDKRDKAESESDPVYEERGGGGGGGRETGCFPSLCRIHLVQQGRRRAVKLNSLNSERHWLRRKNPTRHMEVIRRWKMWIWTRSTDLKSDCLVLISLDDCICPGVMKYLSYCWMFLGSPLAGWVVFPSLRR